MSDIPQLNENAFTGHIEDACRMYMDEVVGGGISDTLEWFKENIFDAAMMAYYGDNVLDWIDEQVDKNEAA